MSDKRRGFVEQLAAARAIVRDVRHSIDQLQEHYEAMRNMYRLMERDLEELAKSFRTWRKCKSVGFSIQPMQVQFSSDPEKVSSQENKESPSPSSSKTLETLEDPVSLPDYRPPQKGHLPPSPPSSTSSKRKAIDNLELRSKEWRNPMDPFDSLGFRVPRDSWPHPSYPVGTDTGLNLKSRRSTTLWTKEGKPDRHPAWPPYVKKSQEVSTLPVFLSLCH
ncbi:hypothetical protein F4679DRAFT_538642 [Xylaria curta]|nr:hypothetical protein F4679DRAFT_538642 [Xylaria curta]